MKKISNFYAQLAAEKIQNLWGEVMHGWGYVITGVLLVKQSDQSKTFRCIYEKSKAKKLFSNMMVKGFAHDLELVLIARKLRFSIKELPIKWTHKDGSKVNIFFEPIKMFLTLLFLKVKYF